MVVFFFNIPTGSYPFQWPLFPLNWLGSFPAGGFISKGLTDFLKIHQPLTWFILIYSCLPALKSPFALEEGPQGLPPVLGKRQSLPDRTSGLGPRAGGGLPIPGIPVALLKCSSGACWPAGAQQRLLCLFRLSPEREDVGIFSTQVYLFDCFFVSLALFFSCGNASKNVPSGTGFSKLLYN